jgi:hypothetical protein
MAKRMTDSDKWADEWFCNLSNEMKLVWLYLLDNCDHAGIYKKNLKLLNYHLNTHLDDEDIIQLLNGRVYVVGDKWFIKKFINFQYGTDETIFNSKVPAVKSVREKLIAIGLLSSDFVWNLEPLYNPSVTLIEPLDKGYVTLQDKDKDKNQDTSKDKNQDTNKDKSKGNVINIVDKALDVLSENYVEDGLKYKALQTIEDVGGLEEVGRIMEWDESQYTKWNKHIKQLNYY